MESTAQEPRGIHRRTEFEVTESLRRRLMSGIDVRGPDECWPWIGALRNGYGAIKHDGKVLGTHVVSYVVHKGPLPDGHLVTHDCDNRVCCNPAHLQAGTNTTNVREMYSRRAVRVTKGEAAWNAVLTEPKVQLIHALSMHGYTSSTGIARLLGVSRDAVNGVLTKGRWSHVEKPSPEFAAEIVRQFESQAGSVIVRNPQPRLATLFEM